MLTHIFIRRRTPVQVVDYPREVKFHTPAYASVFFGFAYTEYIYENTPGFQTGRRGRLSLSNWTICESYKPFKGLLGKIRGEAPKCFKN